MEKFERPQRHTKRLEVEFGLGKKIHKGFLSNLSESGIFIRTSKNFLPGSDLDIKIFLPDGKTSCLQGTVMRQASDIRRFGRSGMGIKLTKADDSYINLLKDLQGGKVDVRVDLYDCEEKAWAEESMAPSSEILRCPQCGAKNNIPTDKLSLGPKCGKCKQPLLEDPAGEEPKEHQGNDGKIIIRCPGCGAKNKLPAEKLSLGPKCGSCKQPIRTA